MNKIFIFDAFTKPNEKEKNEIFDFLFTHLEQYGDEKNDIKAAMDYALKNITSFGGFIIAIKDDNAILGCSVINKTGMKGYIPENILVYIAVHKKYRGQGFGKELMEKAIAYASGDIALHVEADNPAKNLYEKLGFTNPYLEMRLKK